MLKNQIAIFVLLVFFFAQFGRVINYCYCKAVVYQQTKSFICDCEKQLYTLINTDKSAKESPAQSITSSLPSEELFHPSAIPLFIIGHVPCFTAWPKSNAEALYRGFGKDLFRPPLAIA